MITKPCPTCGKRMVRTTNRRNGGRAGGSDWWCGCGYTERGGEVRARVTTPYQDRESTWREANRNEATKAYLQWVRDHHGSSLGIDNDPIMRGLMVEVDLEDVASELGALVPKQWSSQMLRPVKIIGLDNDNDAGFGI